MNESVKAKITELYYWLEQLEKSTLSKMWALKCGIDKLKEEIEKEIQP